MDTTLQNNQIGPGTLPPAPTPTQNKVLGTSQTSPLATTLPTTTNVNASTLGTTPINVPTQTFATTPPVTTNVADEFLKATEVADTEAQKTSQDISTKLFNLIPELKGEAQALATAQEQAGVNTLKKDLQGINSQILKKQAEIAQDDVTLIANMRAEERRDTLLPFAQQGQAKIAGDAAIMRALKTSEIGVLNATALAKQGDIALAMETAKQAVDVKYAPYKEAIKVYEAQLKALEPILSADEKKQARAQEVKGKFAMKEIEKAEAEEKAVQEYVLDGIANGAPASLIERAKKAKTAIEASQILGGYSTKNVEAQIKRSQLAKANADARKAALEDSKSTTNSAVIKAMDSDPDFLKLKGNAELKAALTSYQSAVDEGGAKRVGRSGAAELDTLYQEVLQAYRAAKDLKALQDSDLKLVDDAIKRATFTKTGTGKVLNVVGLGIPSAIKKGQTERGAKVSIDTAFGAIDRNNERLKGVVSAKQPEWVETDYFKTVLGVGGNAQLSNEELLNSLPDTNTNESFFNK